MYGTLSGWNKSMRFFVHLTILSDKRWQIGIRVENISETDFVFLQAHNQLFTHNIFTNQNHSTKP